MKAIVEVTGRVAGIVFVAVLAWLWLLWWGVTALGAAAGVVLAVGEVWMTAVLGWAELAGWKQVYAIGGAGTTIALTALYGPAVLLAFVRLCIRSPFEAFIAALICWSSLIVIIPLLFAGWPFVIWLAWSDKLEKNNRNRCAATKQD